MDYRVAKWRGSVPWRSRQPDVTLQKEKENYKFTFISEEINAWNTFWNILTKLLYSVQKHLSARTHIVYTETSQMICNAKQLAGFQTVHVFSERHFQIDINPFPANVPFKETISWFLQAKCLKSHLWESDIIIKDAGRWSVSLLEMSLYHNYFLAIILLVKSNYISGLPIRGILKHRLEMGSVRF